MRRRSKDRLRVYIAGPYTGNVDLNIYQALVAANLLMNAGHHPFVPHAMYHLLSLHSPRSYEEVMTECFAWIEASDVVLRLPGGSNGADREAVFAEERGIRVCREIGELVIG